jgi:hypothetical protein
MYERDEIVKVVTKELGYISKEEQERDKGKAKKRSKQLVDETLKC